MSDRRRMRRHGTGRWAVPRCGTQMRRRLTVPYWLVPATVAGVVLLLFAVVAASGLPLLVDPVPAMRGAGWIAALIGVGLLVGDVALPVPSSAVMIAHGTLFGLLPGAGLSVLGGVGATVAGFAVGRRGRQVVERVTTVAQRSRADRLLERWGWFAVVLRSEEHTSELQSRQ